MYKKIDGFKLDENIIEYLSESMTKIGYNYRSLKLLSNDRYSLMFSKTDLFNNNNIYIDIIICKIENTIYYSIAFLIGKEFAGNSDFLKYDQFYNVFNELIVAIIGLSDEQIRPLLLNNFNESQKMESI